MIADPPFAVEVAADEPCALLPRQREHEVRDQPVTASDHAGAEHPAQEAAQRQRMVGELEIPVRSRDDPRPHAEGLLELLGVQLDVAAVLVGNAQPVARKAAVRNDVSEDLEERHALIDPQPTGVLDAHELLGNTKLSRQLREHPGTERISEGPRLEHVTQVRPRHADPLRDLLVGETRAPVRAMEQRFAARGDLDHVVVELEARFGFGAQLHTLRQRKSVRCTQISGANNLEPVLCVSSELVLRRHLESPAAYDDPPDVGGLPRDDFPHARARETESFGGKADQLVSGSDVFCALDPTSRRNQRARGHASIDLVDQEHRRL